MRRTLFLIALAACAGACSRSPAEPSGGAEPTPSVASSASSSPAAATTPGHLGRPPPPAPPPKPDITWDAPHRWESRVPSTPMRTSEWRIPRVSPDREDGECFVITFGKGQGGSVDDNVNRWVQQLKPTTSTLDRTTRKVHGMTVTRVEIAGTYTAMAMPPMPASPPRAGYRLVGEIVETPSGTWFFKLTAPDATAKAAGKELDALVDSIRPIDTAHPSDTDR